MRSLVSSEGLTARPGAYRQLNGCETKLCAQLHKGVSRATVPGNRLAASAVEEERGRSWGGSTERNTTRPAQGSEPGAKCLTGARRSRQRAPEALKHDAPDSGERARREVFLEEGCDEERSSRS